MKTIFAVLGALALATTAASAESDGDGGKAQKEFYAVARGDYSLPQTEQLETGRAAAETRLQSDSAGTDRKPAETADNR